MRDGEVKDRLDPADVRILEQEEDLDLDLYYRHATALVLLDDVRVGDRVDFAYSTVGSNPIFAGRFMDWHYLDWWYPLGRIHTRIVAPSDTSLYVRNHRTDVQPVRTEQNDTVELVWRVDGAPMRVSEDAMPPLYW